MATSGNGTSKFTPGAVAEVIALAEPGQEVASGFAPFKQMRYNLVDGRTWYAALKTGVKLANLELALGEPFRVCKRPFGANGSVIDVQRCNPVPAENTGTVLEAKLAESIAAAKRPPSPSAERTGPPADPGPTPFEGLPRKTAAATAPTPAPAVPMNGQRQFYLDQANLMIDLVAQAHKRAVLEYPGLFSIEDTRAMVATVYIQTTAKPQGGR